MTQDHPKAEKAEMPQPEVTSELSDSEMDDVTAGVVTFQVNLDAFRNYGAMGQSATQHAAQLANLLSSGLKPYGG
ncbi:hypothetical protein BKE38_18995 [Pseudoroseomonas deserti]|uniref:Uncharacterized protein n=1 Tax=Teichococcus deserti TaxID=1817963 RepID=A0A1V2GYH5_9PROT|nr:hypothetical protein [Pseudoroseomonas deserti]ONG50171.1 hypothetical protein BKE38_18995 [Pseudoroseomonas deserti]